MRFENKGDLSFAKVENDVQMSPDSQGSAVSSGSAAILRPRARR